MLRLTHRAHGRSYMPKRDPVSENWSSVQAPIQSEGVPNRMSYAVIGTNQPLLPHYRQSQKQTDLLCSIGSEKDIEKGS